MDMMPDFSGLDDHGRALLVRLREAVAPILDNNLIPHFTDHSVSHSDRMVTLIENLVAPLDRAGRKQLSRDERIIVYSACYLHDIGMHYEKPDQIGAIPSSDMPQKWEDLSTETKQSLIRKYHHLVSAKFVHDAGQKSPSVPDIQLSEDYKPSRIACLCESHCIDVKSDRYVELTLPAPNVRMDLLAALLRFADILDESNRRALRRVAETLDLNSKELMHWWRHYYVEHVEISSNGFEICIHFDFPPDSKDEYAQIVPELQMPWISQELANHQRAFGQNELSWYLNHEVRSQPYSNTETMPEEVLGEMIAELRKRRATTTAVQREADLKSFSEAEPWLKRRREELEKERTSISTADYLRKLRELGRQYWELDAKFSAIATLSHEFSKNMNHLPNTERVAMGTDLAYWMKDVGQTFSAVNLLSKLEPVVSTIRENTEGQFKYWLLASDCLNAQARHDEALQAAEQAIHLAPSDSERREIVAKKLEWCLLRGDHASVKSALDDDGKPEESGADRIRLNMIHALADACAKGANAGIEHLAAQEDGQPDEPIVQQVARSFANAYLLYLAGQAHEAIAFWENEIEPLRTKLPPELQITAEANRRMLHMAQGQYRSDFEAIRDKQRFMNLQTWDTGKVLAGLIDFEEGRHAEALPRFWQQVCETYAGYNWLGQQWAHERMCIECLAIGENTKAVWHALLAQNKDYPGKIAQAVCLKADIDEITHVVDVVLSFANLRRFAHMGCILFGEIADAIPEEKIEAVSAWLLKFAEITEGDRGLPALLEATWTALRECLHRLKEASRVRVAYAAMDHPTWTNQNVLRRTLLSVVQQSAEVGLPEDAMDHVAECALPLATTNKNDFDYRETVCLLRTIAKKSGKKLRDKIASEIYPDGEKVNVVLTEAAPDFGRWIRGADNLVSAVEKAADSIRLQVQRLEESKEPVQIGVMNVSKTVNGEKVVVCEGAGLDLLAAMVEHRSKLSPSMLKPLLDALFEMAVNSYNSLGNRVHLVAGIGALLQETYGDVLGKRAAEVLLPMAEGSISESSVLMSSEEANHPLTRFRMFDSSPGSLRGAALYALAEIENRNPGKLEKGIYDVLEPALLATDPDVRGWAFASARLLKDLRPSAISAVLMGTQDVDETAAAGAWRTLAEIQPETLSAFHWHGIVYGLTKATQHPGAGLRRAAASAAHHLLSLDPSGEVETEIERLRHIFAQDVFFLVRKETT